MSKGVSIISKSKLDKKTGISLISNSAIDSKSGVSVVSRSNLSVQVCDLLNAPLVADIQIKWRAKRRWYLFWIL